VDRAEAEPVADNRLAGLLGVGDDVRSIEQPNFAEPADRATIAVGRKHCSAELGLVDALLELADDVSALDFVGSPIVALLLALLFSFWSLGHRRHFTRDQILKFANDCLAPTAAILLVIGAGGGFNRVLVESGVGNAIAERALGSHASPLLLAWIVAALIRVATGSATVAMTTAAGIVAPIAAVTPGTTPELLVLATGAGSLVLSHVNDSGFWLIKEFFLNYRAMTADLTVNLGRSGGVEIHNGNGFQDWSVTLASLQAAETLLRKIADEGDAEAGEPHHEARGRDDDRAERPRERHAPRTCGLVTGVILSP